MLAHFYITTTIQYLHTHLIKYFILIHCICCDYNFNDTVACIRHKKEQFIRDLGRQPGTLFFWGHYARSRLPWFVAGYSGGKKNHSPFPLMCTISRTRSICQNKCHSKMACQVQGGEEIQER